MEQAGGSACCVPGLIPESSQLKKKELGFYALSFEGEDRVIKVTWNREANPSIVLSQGRA